MTLIHARMDTHENAANAIVQLQSMSINGVTLKVRISFYGQYIDMLLAFMGEGSTSTKLAIWWIPTTTATTTELEQCSTNAIR